uniref:NADH-ubiquinone oxidoreductase chain 4 n=1 Tax=Ceratocanthus sp. CER01 TaxID=1205613 RepID=A0A0S2MPM4_9SCAR|nr:NADH deshydrogenase subunit 4 [Ceratocanthus sp. CER01]
MKFIIMLLFMVPLSYKNILVNAVFFLLLSFMYIFSWSFNYLFMNLSYYWGCDLLSFMMVLLSFWICSLMLMASENLYKKGYYSGLFMFMLLMLLVSLILTFSSLNLFIFYIFFEMSLIPTLILIVGWGYQPERLQAGIYLLFYTMFASLPLMLGIFYFYKLYYTLNFFFSFLMWIIYFYLSMSFVFFVKMPMYFVHLWLPKAHVEAPVSGSMILAGVMLKLGGYGLMRLMQIMMKTGVKFNIYFIIISLVGGVLVSLTCLRQFDLKSLIAYSSVAHMGLVMSGILTMNYWGLSASLAMMVAHGLCSSGLFCLANINYERLLSRSFYLNKGLINIVPSMCLWWFLFSSSNMAAPPSLNLLGEIMLINSLIGWNNFLMILIMLSSFFSAAYSLYLFSYSQHGKFYSGLYSFSVGFMREYLLLFLHWFPLNLLILKGEFFVLWI